MAAAPFRFLKPADVAEQLDVSIVQVMALLKSGDLRGVQVGGRNQWRVEQVELEKYVARLYADADKRSRESESAD